MGPGHYGPSGRNVGRRSMEYRCIMNRNSRRSLIIMTARKIIDLSGAVIGSVLKEMANVEND